MSETAYAKINLALHVRSRRPDGYHDLETLFAFAEDGDLLSAEPASDLSLAIVGPFAEGLDIGGGNLVMRAALALQQAFSIPSGARMRLDKRLPIASGIGGGSADAAAALRLLARRWGIDRSDRRIMDIAAGLGADVPACVESRTVRGQGKGDHLVTVDRPDLAGVPLLLVNPGVAVSTPAVFQAWDGVDRGPLAVDLPLARARNDLQAPAIGIAPAIAPMMDWLAAQSGVTMARMSGSGATCFALFGEDDARDAAAAAASDRFPQAWCLATRLR